MVNAYMAARGIGLDLDTLPVIAVGVGFGIDYGIYLLSRIQEGLRDGVALEEAVRDAIHLSGRTVAFTALTMTAGVLCFTPTALRFVGEMATLLALWMVASSATALTLLPALIVVMGRDSWRGRSGGPQLSVVPADDALLGTMRTEKQLLLTRSGTTRRAP